MVDGRGGNVRSPSALRLHQEPGLDGVEMGEGGRNRTLPRLGHVGSRQEVDEWHLGEYGL